MKVHIRMLGDFRVTVGRRTVEDGWEQRRALDLVKLLALTPTHRLVREQVVEALWPHLAPEAAFANLHRAASYARRMLGAKESVVLRGGQVQLWPSSVISTDVEDFDAAAAHALRADDPALCSAAATTYSSDLLPDDVYAEWATEARERLRRQRLDLLRCAGRWEEVVHHDPGDEEAHQKLIRTLVAKGQRHAAMQHCQRLRESLAELNVVPSRTSLELCLELSSGPAALAPVAPDLPPMVGRELELTSARAILDRAGQVSGATLLVTGEAGIGKTRFCESLLVEAADAGWTTIRGSANHAEGTAPWAPVAEAFDRLLRQRPDLARTMPAPAREGLARMFGHASPSLSETGLRGRQPILSAVTALLVEAAKERGVVFWIDDLHEADEATVQLVHYVARASRYERVLVLLTLLPDGLAPTVAQVRASLLASKGTTEIGLGPLQHDDSRTLVQGVAGREVPEAAVATIHRLAEGNPFFTEELAAAIGADGSVAIPHRVYEIVDARLDTLEPRVRAALQRVAVAGLYFTVDELAAFAHLDDPDVSAVLDAALRTGIVVDSGKEGYRFRHVLIREALTALLPPHHRTAAHRRAADALAAHGAPPGRIAHHLVGAGAGSDAVPWLERAAREAAAVGAVADVRALVERALVHAPRRPSLLELRADCLFATGESSSLRAYTEAIAAARGRRRRRLRIRQARAAVVLGDLATATRALDGLEATGAVETVQLLVAHGYAASSRGDLLTAQHHAVEARRIALEEGLVADLADAVTLRALVAHSRGEWPQQMEADLLDTSRAPQLAASVHDGHLCVVEHYLYGECSYDKLIAFALRLRETARLNGADRGEAFATFLLGEAELLAGRLDDAAIHLREGAELHRKVASAAGESLALQRLAEASLQSGRTGDAKSLLTRALNLARESSLLVRHLLPRVYGTKVRAAERPEDALAIIAEAESSIIEAREACRMCSITFAIPAAHAFVRAGQCSRARDYLSLAQDVTRGVGRDGAWTAAIAEVEAAIADAEGNARDAGEWLYTAAELFSIAGHPNDARRCRQAAVVG